MRCEAEAQHATHRELNAKLASCDEMIHKLNNELSKLRSQKTTIVEEVERQSGVIKQLQTTLSQSHSDSETARQKAEDEVRLYKEM